MFGELSEFDPWGGDERIELEPLVPIAEWLAGDYAPVEAARLTATMVLTDAATATSRQVTLDGTFSSDGRFEATERKPGIDPDGEAYILETRVAFDGRTLTVMTEGAPDATAWVPGTGRARTAFALRAYWAPMVMSWLRNPLSLNRGNHPSWTTTTTSPTEVHVARDSDNVQQLYVVATALGVQVLSMEKRALGVPYKRLEFEGQIEVSETARRPERITRTDFAAGTARKVYDLHVRRATRVPSVGPELGRVSPSSGRWLVLP